MSPVTAAQPMTGGSAPAAPPRTMFCGVRPLEQQRVDDDVEADREEREERRHEVRRERQPRERDDGQDEPERERVLRRDLVSRAAAGGACAP